MTTYPDATPDWQIPLLRGNVVNDWRQLNDAYLAVDAAISRATKDAIFTGATLLDPIVRDTVQFGAEPDGAVDATLRRASAGLLTTPGGFGFDRVGATPGLAFGLHFRTDGRLRWRITADPDTGSNTGSDLFFQRYADDGTTLLSNMMQLTRGSGTLSLFPEAGFSALNLQTRIVHPQQPAILLSRSTVATMSQWISFQNSLGNDIQIGRRTNSDDFIIAGWNGAVLTDLVTVGAATGTLGLTPAAGQRSIIATGDVHVTGAYSSRVGGAENLAGMWFENSDTTRKGFLGLEAGNANRLRLYGNIGSPGDRLNIDLSTGTVFLQPIEPNPALTWGFGRLRSSAGTPFVDGQTGGYLMLGGGATGNALSVAPAQHNAIHLGWGDRGWALTHSVGGVVQDSAADAKQDIVPLAPADAMDAVRATDAVTFAYTAPPRPPASAQAYRRTGRFDWRAERSRLVTAPLLEAARRQSGFLAEQAHPLLLTGEGHVNPNNTAGVLLAALKGVLAWKDATDARLAALEGA